MLRRTSALTLALLGAYLLLACGDSNPPSTQTAPERSSSAAPERATSDTPSPADSVPAPQKAPGSDAKPAEPAAQGPHDPAAGAALYAQYCATCHGDRGGGDGPASQGLDPKPAKHHDGHYMNKLSNEHIFKVIKEGGVAVGKSPLMTPWGGALSDEQIWDLVAFVRSLADPPYTGPKP